MFTGRPVRDGEPMWLPADTELALEWQAEQAITCSGCGQPRDESTRPEARGLYDVHTLVCAGCEARADWVDEHPDRAKEPGLHLVVLPADPKGR